MIPPDIEQSIFSTLQQLFAQKLQSEVAGDPLALKTLKKAPLQDDPTAVAPYLVYQKCPDLGVQRMTKEEAYIYGDVEIGGPMRFLIYFDAICGTPLATTREEADNAICNLVSRIMTVLASYPDLSGFTGSQVTSPDVSRVIEGANSYYMFNKEARTRFYGGESTWYGEGHINWRYPVSWYVPSQFV